MGGGMDADGMFSPASSVSVQSPAPRSPVLVNFMDEGHAEDHDHLYSAPTSAANRSSRAHLDDSFASAASLPTVVLSDHRGDAAHDPACDPAQAQRHGHGQGEVFDE